MQSIRFWWKYQSSFPNRVIVAITWDLSMKMTFTSPGLDAPHRVRENISYRTSISGELTAFSRVSFYKIFLHGFAQSPAKYISPFHALQMIMQPKHDHHIMLQIVVHRVIWHIAPSPSSQWKNKEVWTFWWSITTIMWVVFCLFSLHRSAARVTVECVARRVTYL